MYDRKLLLINEILPTAAEQLALDEALLEEIDRRGGPSLLRLWECPQTAVILGAGSSAADEVDLAACRRDGVPVLRRHTGGGVVVIGPGCLAYSLVLPHEGEEQRFHIRATTRVLLERIAAALRERVPSIRVEGVSDLAVGSRKVSGNAQRWLRNTLLHHGTILYDFPLDRISRYLKAPARQPAYRRERPHGEFVTNLPLGGAALRSLLAAAWNATEGPYDLPIREVRRLVETKYALDAWNLKR